MSPSPRLAHSLAVLFFSAICALAGRADQDRAADYTDTQVRERLRQGLEREIPALTEKIGKSPSDVGLYSARGDQRFFRGDFEGAVADFEKMVELSPELDTGHWRKGIALFYVGRYEDAATQFDKYFAVDRVDRENGIWRYLSQVKSLGADPARERLHRYEARDREPFPDVYRMFAGELTGDELLARIRQADIKPADRELRLFYAELYVGLYEFVHDRAESAEQHLREATRNPWGAQATGGPHWMWHVARVHHDLLRDDREKEQAARE